METITIEQAIFRRTGARDPESLAHSAAFGDDWLAEACRPIVGYGDRPPGVACPHAVFAQPFLEKLVAIVQVADQEADLLAFHFLIIDKRDYESFLGDPFQIARDLPPSWQERGTLPTLSWPRQPLPRRTTTDVCKVLAKIKGKPLPEDVDPDSAILQRSAETAESPALLGGAQVLVDGGRLVFQRRAPDPGLIEGLWTLLPTTTRNQLWPASFAFSNDLEFDALVLPRIVSADFEGYTTEEQALNYPEGYFELNLQIAAESGDQRQLDGLLDRRSGRETIRLALILMILFMCLALLPKIMDLLPKGPIADPEEHLKLATAASMVGTAHPWSAMGVYLHGKTRWGKK